MGRQWVAGWVVKGERERPVVRGRDQAETGVGRWEGSQLNIETNKLTTVLDCSD